MSQKGARKTDMPGLGMSGPGEFYCTVVGAWVVMPEPVPGFV